jgi:hypothetical protein
MMRFHAIPRLDGGDHDGIHLLWSPPYPAGHSLDGFTIFRRDFRRQEGRQCFALPASLLTAARSLGYVSTPDGTVWSRAHDHPKGVWTYRVDLNRRHSLVAVSGGPARAVFAGLADGTVLSGDLFAGPSVTLRGTGIGVIWIVTDGLRASFEICGDVVREGDGGDWRPIVRHLQVPFASVSPAVVTTADGLALATSRAQPDPLDGDFDDLSAYANAALERPDGVPAFRVISERPGEDGNAWDVSPLGLALAPSILPAWQRGWGFAHIDRDGLTPGERYDYRIVGTVRRRDRDERMYDLHTVPRGYRLPRCFRWGTALVWTQRPLVVEAVSSVPGDPTTIRKGIDSDGLVVLLDVPRRRIVLEATPGATVHARGFRHGGSVATVTETTSARTLLDFGADVDRIKIEGRLAVTGIVPAPLDPALDPDEPVEISQTIYDVEFVSTPPPAAPDTVSVVNLSDPARTAARGVLDTNRGFEVDWDAPPSLPASVLPWYPADAASAPPTEVARYRLERSREGRPFEPQAGDGTQVSGRNASSPTDSPAWGFDLLGAFPPADAAPGSYSDVVRAIEIFEPGVLRYGDEIVYRVFSVDAIGRESAPRSSAPTPLRKFVRPPQPTTPPQPAPTDPAALRPSGVEVMLIQHDDPDLTTEQRELADGGDIVRVRWGWGPAERDLDPDVTEFRVYEHDGALTEIGARTTAVATATGSGWSLPVEFDRVVAADEFSSLVIFLGGAFRIVSHGAGTSVTLTLADNAVDSAVAPRQGEFSVVRTTAEELNPETWHRRVAIVPRAPAPPGSDQVEAYEITVPASWIAVDATRPRQRAAIGVTAVDAEPYIADRRAAVESQPRPGNESTVAAREVTARYFGRPTLAVSDLADVAALTLPRQAGSDVHGTVRPADALPPGFVPAPRMRLERVPASAVLPRVRVTPGGIHLLGAEGAAMPWPLSPSDEAALRAEDAAGAVSDRFLAHAAARLDGLDAAATFLAIVDPGAPFEDTLPNRPARWLYRLRAVDGAGRPSADGQVLPLVLHVPSPARSVAPRLESLEIAGGVATVLVRARGEAGESVYVFHAADDALMSATATLATIRNREDIAPDARLVVRDEAGRHLTATSVTLGAEGAGVAIIPVPSDGIVLHVWAVSITSDGVPSRLVGPLNAATLEAGT